MSADQPRAEHAKFPIVTSRGDGTIVVRTGIAPSGRFVTQLMSERGFDYVVTETESEASAAHEAVVARTDQALARNGIPPQ